jgi:Lrp/AsnC family transcriptional regulator, leucine-responsive regulatory protein
MDNIDKKLLQLLTHNGRMTQAALAAEVGLSRPSVIDRIRKLEDAGIIQGYVAHIDRRKLGKPICAIVSLHFRSGSISDEEEISIRALADDPDIIECHKVAGEESAILKIVTSSIESLEQILTRIRDLDAISSTKTNVVLSTYFEKPGVQI